MKITDPVTGFSITTDENAPRTTTACTFMGRHVKQAKEKAASPTALLLVSPSNPLNHLAALAESESMPPIPTQVAFPVNAEVAFSSAGWINPSELASLPLEPIPLPQFTPVLLPKWAEELKAFDGVSLEGRNDLICQIVTIVQGHITVLPDALFDKVTQELNKMTELSLPGIVRFRPHALQEIALYATNLEKLDLAWCDITDEHVQFLREMPKLTHLDLAAAQLTNMGLRMVAQYCPNLVELNLDYLKCPLADSLQSLKECKNLKKLSLYNCSKVDDTSITYLVAIPKLQRLDVAESCLTNAGIRTIGEKARKLEWLNVANDLITNLTPLLELRHLETLYTTTLVPEFDREALIDKSVQRGHEPMYVLQWPRGRAVASEAAGGAAS